MKTKNLLLTAGLLAGLSFPLSAADKSTENSPITVNFEQPDKFTDVKSSYNQQGSNEGYLKELRRHLERTASRRLADGQRLAITITDVDMAGDFEPWRSPSLMDVRIVKDIYPPRIDLSFQLTDASGNVVAQGERELRNLAFSMTSSPINRDDPLRYEKDMLDDFVRDVTRAAKKNT